MCIKYLRCVCAHDHSYRIGIVSTVSPIQRKEIFISMLTISPEGTGSKHIKYHRCDYLVFVDLKGGIVCVRTVEMSLS